MRTDTMLLEPAINTKVYLSKGYVSGKEVLVITSLLADNNPLWVAEDAEELGITTAKLMQRVKAKWDPNGDPNDWECVLISDMPTDCSYRDAWRYDKTQPNNIGIDTAHAKALHKDLIRIRRSQKFTDLDVQFQRALESSSSTTSIVTNKQTLRDLPIQVDSLNVTETSAVGVTTQLHSVWNDSLLDTFDSEDGLFIAGIAITSTDYANNWHTGIGST